MNNLRDLKIGVLMGGCSSEREISLKSGEAVSEALMDGGLKPRQIDLTSEDIEIISSQLKEEKIDLAFIALHGRFGEDGQIQKLLESLNIPYTGSGIRASRLGMDKLASREIFQKENIPVPSYKVIKKDSDFNINKLNGFPLVVKPASSGSSIGVSFIYERRDLHKAVQSAFCFDERLIVEEYIEGKELTVGILDERALAVIEICTKKSFFDYQAKYEVGMSEYHLPAELPSSIYTQTQQLALRAHKALRCQGFSRIDMILNRKSQPVILELNSIPGLTKTSLLPKAAKYEGISFTQLILRLIELALTYEKKD